ncbi:hypothetical protein HYH03_006711 [Edaphochlamys debaryana]|uniref:Multiple inositol polyphosphate phosphatase 1 n=1 Tax=Edaphochlamys debaryana TaxID=47281 RepID=A0A836BZT3_9CHLO|nr:hypothetical protein HYH03_006711 [Edaphochlamys debaryana]|eukprot:KAG2495101.1 hypothetical protein HYH03_006711 [Edaphochlamys debaryana]
MNQINTLETLFRDSRNTADYPWLSNWTAPFPDTTYMGGELHPIGADELWGLAYRLRKRFPSLALQPYLPKRFPVVSTQVARTAASASAFTSGFFPAVASVDPRDDSPEVRPAPASHAPILDSQLYTRHMHIRSPDEDDTAPQRDQAPGQAAAKAGSAANGNGNGNGINGQDGGVSVLELDGSGLRRSTLHRRAGPTLSALDELDESLHDVPIVRRPQAVAMSMAPKDADPLLRFFDVCPAYAQHDEFTEEWMDSWMQGHWARLLPSLEQRLGLSRPMDPCEVEALWQLCLLEAGLLGRADGACTLFEPEEAVLLEWVEDVHLMETQSWGAPINYQIAAPLLRDAALALRQAAQGNGAPGTEAPAARLLFAHCETLVPLATLLGLFQPAAPPPEAAPGGAAEAAVPAGPAQRHLRAVDSVEDLGVLVAGLQRLNARGPDGAPLPLPLRSEDSHACYQGRTPTPDAVPPPPGWRPLLPLEDGRLFKGARVAPFAANMAFVLYRRKAGAASGSPQHVVRLLYNEQVLPIPGCSKVGAGGDCDLEEFLELVKDKIDPDALQKLCGAAGGGETVAGDGGASTMYARAQGGAAAAEAEAEAPGRS